MFQTSRNLLPYLTLVTVLLVITAHIYFVEGVRGTDQYWYMDDTETLATNSPPVTNMIFPGAVIRAGSADFDTYFAHNGPILHLNAQFAKFVGAFNAWKYTNLLFFLLAALFTGLTLTSLMNRTWGYLGAIVYLLTPINLWMAGNFLQETLIGLISSFVMYVFVTQDKSRIKIILLLIALFVGAQSHPLFLIIGVFYGLHGLIIRRNAISSLLAIGVVIAANILKTAWFPTSFPPSIRELITASIPGVGNSLWQLSDTIPELNLAFLLNKFTHALQVQFLPSPEAPLYLVTNIGLIAFFALCFNRQQKDWNFLYLSAIFMLSYGGLIVLMQNQVRYQLSISTVSIVCTLLWMSGWQWKTLRTGLLASVIAIYCIIDFKMLQKIQIDGRSSNAGLVVFEEHFEFIESDARVALLDNTLGGWLSVTSALRPVTAMPIFRSVLTDDSFDKVIALYQPDYIFTKEGYSMDELPNAIHIMTVQNPALFNIEIYQLGALNQ